ncbi:hypothetical protein GEMRC1_007719 [Eukaryota sp. GEM-RC1]
MRCCCNILGQDPLLPGNVYSWRILYSGYPLNIFVGVINESNFKSDEWCEDLAHGCFNGFGDPSGCLSGKSSQWDEHEILEISVDMTKNVMTIRSVGNDGISLTGVLPMLSQGYYYPFFVLYRNDHVIELVD